jgi:hypothetical protein
MEAAAVLASQLRINNCFVGSVDIQNQVDVQLRGHVRFDGVEEFAKLRGAMALVSLSPLAHRMQRHQQRTRNRRVTVPPAAKRATRKRIASACAVLDRLLRATSCARSLALKDSGLSGRPFAVGAPPLYSMTYISLLRHLF